jgi:hypothetical protein
MVKSQGKSGAQGSECRQNGLMGANIESTKRRGREDKGRIWQPDLRRREGNSSTSHPVDRSMRDGDNAIAGGMMRLPSASS